jgi:hypothetical protein
MDHSEAVQQRHEQLEQEAQQAKEMHLLEVEFKTSQAKLKKDETLNEIKERASLSNKDAEGRIILF